MSEPDWQSVEKAIAAATGSPFSIQRKTSVGGGCINTAYRLSDGKRDYFVKCNRSALLSMFEAEMAALQEMVDAGAIRVPHPVSTGESGASSWLVLEYIEFGGGTGKSQALAGEQLAKMHRKTADAFGWNLDNTIGSTPQLNDWNKSWINFWREQRLGYQLQLAGHQGSLQRQGEKLLESFHLLIDHAPQPSLLHGDLWGGNIGYDDSGNPVIFDPALYFGDREADIAMTELFGGFGREFYAAYNAAWPLDAGYPIRKKLYNLYHILNHLNLFGSGYLGQAEGMIDSLLAETIA
ncbi:fructosamine kinase family protein [Solemya velum gill symbiont]|uniref:Fructosamine-3-kinase n=1 Tax=Solemya velum gill symbiont TaxID=2340 RepID=A0A0B0H9F9_SOVGS|nr:fructosamine kinase family protein [Solemya velum gill symbiont]KHF25282.1 fructosamine-3-kinase [Solemya velum gill symbiont]OOY35173.1 hypothetical protein BOV88_06570 [Solemya velum gill symbiont]OOY37811.1 hypothetical protein BOV89_05140 [Solemya velum gill symbiont]OOY41106.1 hypothetical protein BOV90_00480 [Solemya velum gill symbiont]OOY43358.1 hypothetical protein BOV92_11465 [Solemya velum gill symbiont]